MRPDNFKLSDGQKVICRYGTRNEHRYSSRGMNKHVHIKNSEMSQRIAPLYCCAISKPCIREIKLRLFIMKPYRPKPI
jgi:hypothetical protein